MYVPNGMAPGQCQQDREVGYVDGVKDVSGDTASVASRLLLMRGVVGDGAFDYICQPRLSLDCSDPQSRSGRSRCHLR